MSATTFNSISDGDWGAGTIWNPASVPNAPTVDVTIASNVTIGSAESFAAGTVTVDSGDSLQVNGGLGVAGALDVLGAMLDTGSVTVAVGFTLAIGADLDLGDVGFGAPPPVLSVGTLTAGNYLLNGNVGGEGTLAGAGTLIANGHIFTNFGDTLTIAASAIQVGATGLLSAFGNDSILTIAPTGSFANLSAGTLTGGTYSAGGGTLVLPGAVDAIVDTTLDLPDLGGVIDAGTSAIQSTLKTIGSGADLNIDGADYVTANTLTVNGGTVTPGFGGTLSAGGLTLATAASMLAGPGTVAGAVADDGQVTLTAGTLAIDGAIAGDGSIDINGVSTITAASVTLDGGSVSVRDGTLAVAGTLSMTGGTIAISAGEISAATLLLAGATTTLAGSGTIAGSIDNAGLIDANGETDLTLAGPVAGAGSMEIAVGNTLSLGQGSSQAVGFDPVGFGDFGAEYGKLVLTEPVSFTGTLDGFTTAVQHDTIAADSIELVGSAPGTLTDHYQGTSAGGALTIDSGATVVATLAFAGDYRNAMFTLEPDGGNTDVKIAAPPLFSDAANGDWGLTSSWSPATVPDSTAANVLIDQHTITIAAGESFSVGTLTVSGTADGEFPMGTDGALGVAGTLDVAQVLTVDSLAELQVTGTGEIDAGSIDNTSFVPINGAGTVISGGTVGGQFLADIAGQTLTVMPAAFDGGMEATFAGATLLIDPTDGASGFLNAPGGDFSKGVIRLEQGGTVVVPGTISEISGSTQVTLDGPGAAIIAGGAPLQDGLTELGYGAVLSLDDYDYQGPLVLAVGGFVDDGGGSGTLAPAGLQLLATGGVDASGTLVLAPGTFSNLAGGTLSVGSYGASGTLELPGAVDVIANTTVTLAGGEILTGGNPIQNSLSLIGAGAELAITTGSYATANTLTVDGGTIQLSGFETTATLDAAALTLDPGASVLQGAGTVSAGIDNEGLILANAAAILDLTGSVAGAGSLEIASQGSLELAQANAETVVFEPNSAGVLLLPDPGSYSGTLVGFGNDVQGGLTAADRIDLPGVAPGGLTDVYNGDTAGGALTIESGHSIVSTLAFAGDYSQSSFTLEPDGGAGTFIAAIAPPVIKSDNHGDWSVGTIWNTGTAPNSAADYVLLQTQVTIAAGESFTVGTLEIGETNLFVTGDTFLSAIGTLDAAQLVTIDFDAELLLGAAAQGGVVVTGSIHNAGSIVGIGTLAVGGGVGNTGLIDATAGLLDITGAVTGSGSLEIGDGATLELGGASGEAAGFDPLGPGGTLDVLKLDNPASYTGTISGFTAEVTGGVTSADAVDLVGLAPGTLTPVYNGVGSGGTLAISNGSSIVASLAFAGNYVNAHFTLDPDGTGGSDVELVPCFCAGTRIATPLGEVAVEDLHAGDQVLTVAGARKRIRWIGHRHVACARHERPDQVWPVRIRAGAFGDHQPIRDLLLSPDHAVLRAGDLIPIRYLVNGASVVQEPRDAVTYWHVELDRHDVLLAEGLPCESYLDTGNRSAFAGGGLATTIYRRFGVPIALDAPR